MLQYIVALVFVAGLADVSDADILNFELLSENPGYYPATQSPVYITGKPITYKNKTWPAGSTVLYTAGNDLAASITEDLVSWEIIEQQYEQQVFGGATYCFSPGGIAYVIPFLTNVDDIYDIFSTENMTTWKQIVVDGTGTAILNYLYYFNSVVDHNGHIYIFFGLNAETDVYFLGVIRSIDQGYTWNVVSYNSTSDARRSSAAVTIVYGKVNDTIYALGGYNDKKVKLNDLWITQDNGASWKPRFLTPPWTPPESEFYMLYTLISTSNGLLVVHFGDAQTYSQIWTSADTGYKWILQAETPAFGPRMFPSLYVNPKGYLVVISGQYQYTLAKDVWISTTPIKSISNL